MKTARTVLLTRPRAESEKLAAEVEKRGLVPFIEPMLEIVHLDVTLPDLTPFQAFIFTSANGVDALARLSDVRDKPVFAVGNATAARAAAHGFRDINTGSGDLEELNKVLKDADPEEGVPVLHISGEHTAGDIAAQGVPVERIVAYRADQRPIFSAECLRLLDESAFAAAMFYSPRTAENFAALLQQESRTENISTIKALCISEAVVKCLHHLPWRDVQVADTPTRNGMLRLLEALTTDIGLPTENDGMTG